MNIYSIVLYLHIVGALLLFVAMGIEFVTVSRLRSTVTAEQARDWLSVLGSIRVIGPVALVAILVPGLYMAATSAGWEGWNILALVAMVGMAALAGSSAARTPAIGRSIGPLRGPLPPDARAGLRDRIVWSSILTRIGIGLGVVLLMTAKPDLVGSIVTLVAFAAAGVAVAFATSGTAPGSTEPRGLERAS